MKILFSQVMKSLVIDIKQFIKASKKPLIVILGPTASGKTALSLKIAKEINGEIISTDSRQLYKGMEISTDAISSKEQEKIPHHLMGITTPDKTITLAEYKDLALNSIKSIYKRKSIPILVGGTGLYISAIIKNFEIPRMEPDKKLREKLEKEAKERGKMHVYKKLEKLNKDAAAKIHPNNLRYVIRAIEIAKAKKTPGEKEKEFDVYMIGILWPRAELYKRIEQRVDRQIERGLVKEGEKLLKEYDKNLPAMSSLGVKEIIPYIEKEKSLDECIEILKRNTRRYAKRQMTWFRKYDNVKWLSPEKLMKLLKNG